MSLRLETFDVVLNKEFYREARVPTGAPPACMLISTVVYTLKCITELVRSSHNQPCEAMYALTRLYP